MDRKEHSDLEVIRAACAAAVRERWSAGVPDEVSQRVERELCRLEKHPDWAELYLLLHELSAAAARTGATIRPNGSVNDSYVAYLLGNRELEPLTTYYYCMRCGSYSEEPQFITGLELPPGICPRCGAELRRGGFSRHPEYVLSPECRLDPTQYWMPRRFQSVACRVVERFYAGRGRTTLSFPLRVEEDGTQSERTAVVAALPRGTETRGKRELWAEMLGTEVCWIDGADHIFLTDRELLDRLDAAQWEAGLLPEDLPAEKLTFVRWYDLIATGAVSAETAGILAEHRPESFSDLARCFCTSRGSFQYLSGEEMTSRLPLRAEEQFDALQYLRIAKCRMTGRPARLF